MIFVISKDTKSYQKCDFRAYFSQKSHFIRVIFVYSGQFLIGRCDKMRVLGLRNQLKSSKVRELYPKFCLCVCIQLVLMILVALLLYRECRDIAKKQNVVVHFNFLFILNSLIIASNKSKKYQNIILNQLKVPQIRPFFT